MCDDEQGMDGLKVGRGCEGAAAKHHATEHALQDGAGCDDRCFFTKCSEDAEWLSYQQCCALQCLC